MKIIEQSHQTLREASTIKLITNQIVAHDLLYRRLPSSREFGIHINYDQLEFIKPVWCPSDAEELNQAVTVGSPLGVSDEEWIWALSCLRSEEDYGKLLEFGWRPEQAKFVLNSSLKTEFVLSYNEQEWFYLFTRQCRNGAHPQVRELMCSLLHDFASHDPFVFGRLSAKVTEGSLV